jgi:hypothetical protein
MSEHTRDDGQARRWQADGREPHRQLDRDHARDGGQTRRWQAGGQREPRVLLMQLSECVSSKGSRYLSGFLGKASVVAFEAKEPDRFGRKCWDVFVSTPRPKADHDTGGSG